MLSKRSLELLTLATVMSCCSAQYERYPPEYETNQLFQPNYQPFREPIVHHREPAVAYKPYEERDLDFHAHPKYAYDYSVKDPATGDEKEHWETRDGDKVRGTYTLTETDGTKRIVEYEADDKNGFNAVVHKIGVPNQEAAVPQGIRIQRPRRPQYEPTPHFPQGFEDGGFVPMAPF